MPTDTPSADPAADTASATTTPLDEHLRQLRASGQFAAGSQLGKLFGYLDACRREGRTPKETEIAIEALGRHSSFDATQDALVRVYMHKLRRKLEDFYHHPPAGVSGLSGRVVVPKGEYRLVWEAPPAGADETEPAPLPAPPSPAPAPRRLPLLLLALAALLLLSLAANLVQGLGSDPATRQRHSPLWSPLFADERPVIVVVGDYYTFAEADPHGEVKRLAREFDINSPLDLAHQLQRQPELRGRRFDIGLSYLPTSLAQALFKLAPVLTTGRKPPWGVVLSSELIPENLRTSHIVYVGHLSALQGLEDLLLPRSGFRFGRSYDELIDRASGRHFVSGNGIPQELTGQYNQLAYLAAFTAPAGNRIVIVAGCRDEGLKLLTNALTGERGLEELRLALAAMGGDGAGSGGDFEALYQFNATGSSTAGRPDQPTLIRPLHKASGSVN